MEKKEIVTKYTYVPFYELLDGSLEDVVNKFNLLLQKWGKDAVVDYDADDKEINIAAKREETDEEFNLRLKTYQLAKEKQDAEELKLYQYLKNKYES